MGVLTALTACGTITDVFSERAEIADRIARSGNMTKYYVRTGTYELAGYRRFSDTSNETVSVYIEGDGLAFLSTSTVSRDPTPRDPISLRMAAIDPSSNVAYIARPCQYVDAVGQASCQQYTYWTRARFAPEVVQETNRAVDAVVAATGATRVRLYGYSGGGVLATLIAGMRSDVSDVTTFGSPLNHVEWTRIKGYTPLDQSVNPMDHLRSVVNVPQRHFIGAEDDVVPVQAVSSYADALNDAGGNAEVIILAGVDHRCCWVDIWTEQARDHTRVNHR